MTHTSPCRGRSQDHGAGLQTDGCWDVLQMHRLGGRADEVKKSTDVAELKERIQASKPLVLGGAMCETPLHLVSRT